MSKIHPPSSLLMVRTLLWGALFSIACLSCDNPGPGPGEVDFDQEALLAHLSADLIVPAYADLADATASLKGALETLTTAPNATQLATARESLRAAWTAWQATSAFEFGPASLVILRSSVNIYPTSTQQIEDNILTGNYELEAINNLDAKGFPALDYLLNAEADTTTVAALEDADRAAYLMAVATDLDNLVQQVYQAWLPTGGNYQATFNAATGTDAGSSLGALINQLNYDFELLKNAQIGIPLGKRTLGEAQPMRTQAYYGGYSAQLAKARLQGIHALYYGIGADDSNGLGLDDYVKAFNLVFDGETELSEAIANQMARTEAAVNALPDPLSEAVTNQASIVESAWNEIQAQLILYKTDMPSALGVLITYQDNDGD